jgi:hypothetical protein
MMPFRNFSVLGALIISLYASGTVRSGVTVVNRSAAKEHAENCEADGWRKFVLRARRRSIVSACLVGKLSVLGPDIYVFPPIRTPAGLVVMIGDLSRHDEKELRERSGARMRLVGPFRVPEACWRERGGLRSICAPYELPIYMERGTVSFAGDLNSK